MTPAALFDARPALISTRLMFGVAVGITLLGAIAAASMRGRRFGRAASAEEPSSDQPDPMAEPERDAFADHEWSGSGALIVIVEDDELSIDEDGILLADDFIDFIDDDFIDDDFIDDDALDAGERRVE